MKKVIFLCTANSCRSQMAEGLARHLGRGKIEAYSAGIFATYVHPRAIAVMKEIGIDISGQSSKEMDRELLDRMDVIVTVCDNAREACPVTPPGIRRLHWPIKDPVGATGKEEEVLNEFRRARDELKEKILGLIKSISEEKAGGE